MQQQHTEVAGWAVRVVQANDVVDSERQHLGPSPPGRVAEVEEAGFVGDEEDAVAGAVDLEAAFVPDARGPGSLPRRPPGRRTRIL